MGSSLWKVSDWSSADANAAKLTGNDEDIDSKDVYTKRMIELARRQNNFLEG